MATKQNNPFEAGPEADANKPGAIHYMVPLDLPSPTVPWSHEMADHLKPEEPDPDRNFIACVLDNTFSKFMAQRYGQIVYSVLLGLVVLIWIIASIVALVFALSDHIIFIAFVAVVLLGPIVLVQPMVLTIRTLFEFVIAGLVTAQNTTRLVRMQEEYMKHPRVMAEVPLEEMEVPEEPTE